MAETESSKKSSSWNSCQKEFAYNSVNSGRNYSKQGSGESYDWGGPEIEERRVVECRNGWNGAVKNVVLLNKRVLTIECHQEGIDLLRGIIKTE